MDLSQDRRSKPRIVVGPDCLIQFQVGAQLFQEVRVTNLSVVGCFATLPRGGRLAFQQGTRIEHLLFDHPGLPTGAITGEVAYVLGEQAGKKSDLIGLGIRFSAMDAVTLEGLEAYIASRL